MDLRPFFIYSQSDTMSPMNFPNLSTRQLQPELMDSPDVDVIAHEQALKGLCRINTISCAASAAWSPIRELAKKSTRAPLRILDVASGSGDTVIQIKQKSEKEKIPITIAGCDKSETAVQCARKNAASAKADAEFFQFDISQDVLPETYDVIMCSLFLHHLTREDALRWMRTLKNSGAKTVIINDLERSALGFAAAFIGSRILTRSPIVHFDAVQSVRNAFSAREMKQLALEAGWKNFTIRKIWPFRFQFLGNSSD